MNECPFLNPSGALLGQMTTGKLQPFEHQQSKQGKGAGIEKGKSESKGQGTKFRQVIFPAAVDGSIERWRTKSKNQQQSLRGLQNA
jgi:hypothetical protein